MLSPAVVKDLKTQWPFHLNHVLDLLKSLVSSLFFVLWCQMFSSLFADSVFFDISPITIVLYVKLLMTLEKCFRMQLWVKRVYIKQLCSSLGVSWAEGKGWWMYVSQAWPAGVDWLKRPRLRPRFWSFCNTMVLKMELASCIEKHFESLLMFCVYHHRSEPCIVDVPAVPIPPTLCTYLQLSWQKLEGTMSMDMEKLKKPFSIAAMLVSTVFEDSRCHSSQFLCIIIG